MPRLPLLLLVVLLAGCSGPRPDPAGPAVMVADFACDPALLAEDAPAAPGVVGRLRQRVRTGEHGSPEQRAAQLTALLADTLVADLTKAGIAARRLRPGEAPPAAGWLVSGRFLVLDEGDRLRRSAIGLGEGATAAQVAAALCDAAHPGRPADPLLEGGSSGHAPGSAAATAITRTPWGAAARFVRSGKDLDGDVKAIAGDLAAAVAQRVRQGAD